MRNYKTTVILITAMFAGLLAGWTYTFDTATPVASESPTLGYSRIQEVKTSLRERLDVDHYFELTGTEVSDSAAGQHRKITFHSQIATPTGVADKGFLYIKDADSKAELFWLDEDDNELQITRQGAMHYDGGEMTLKAANPSLDFYESDQVLPAGLFQMQVQGDEFIFAHNTAAGGDYSTSDTILYYDSDDVLRLIDGVQTYTDAAPDEDKDIANKKYVDDAIPAAFDPSAMTGSSNSTGEVTLPNGLEMKWGATSITDSETVSFATEGLTAFSDACFQVTAVAGSGGTWAGGLMIDNISTSGFDADWGGTRTATIRWFAIGR